MTVIRFNLTERLKARRVTGIKYDNQYSIMQINYRGKPIIFSILPKDIKKSVEIFYTVVNGVMDERTKNEVISFITDEWGSNISNSDKPQDSNDNSDNHDIANDLNGSKPIGNPDLDINLSTDARLQNIPKADYINFVISTIKKTVKREDMLIRQILYTGLSAYTLDPINLGIIAPTSEGKTYAVTQVMKYFPKGDVWNIGSMSTKVLVREKGTLVDSNNQNIEIRVSELKARINESIDEKEKRSLTEELNLLLKDPKRLIDLQGKTLVFLEPPQSELWVLLKPILSHDLPEIEFPYVDKTIEDGIVTKKVVVRGAPACIFCSARDESKWPMWPEIQSRFLITSPNMIAEKYFESNILIGQRKGLPNLIQQYIIVSHGDINLAKECISYIKNRIVDLYKSNGADYDHNNNPVWIPYCQILATSFQSNKGIDNRATTRIFSLLNIVPLARMNHRFSLVFGEEKLVIASLEDLAEVLNITQNVTGIPTHKMQFYRDVFIPLFKSKESPDQKDGRSENRIGVTTSQLCEHYRIVMRRTITSNNLKQTYLNELLNNGHIDEEDSELDKRGKVYFPLIELPVGEISDYKNSEKMDNILQYSKILPSKNFSGVDEGWLKSEILKLLRYPVKLGKFQLLDKNGNELCICRFIEEYEKHNKLNGFFVIPETSKFSSKIFGTLQLMEKIPNKEDEKLSIHPEMPQNDILNSFDYQHHLSGLGE